MKNKDILIAINRIAGFGNNNPGLAHEMQDDLFINMLHSALSILKKDPKYSDLTRKIALVLSTLTVNFDKYYS